MKVFKEIKSISVIKINLRNRNALNHFCVFFISDFIRIYLFEEIKFRDALCFFMLIPYLQIFMRMLYRKNPKNSDTQTIAVIILKLEQNCFTTDE